MILLDPRSDDNLSALPDIELKEAQRFFAQKFSCGASVTAEDEIIIQGDFTDDIIDVIQEKWPEVSRVGGTFVSLNRSYFLFSLDAAALFLLCAFSDLERLKCMIIRLEEVFCCMKKKKMSLICLRF